MIAIFGKLVWFMLAPSNFLIVLLALAMLLLALTGWRWLRRLAGGALVLLLIGAFSPAGDFALGALEARFPQPSPPPERVDGVIVLGGGMDVRVSEVWGQPALGPAGERLTTLIELAKRWPAARLVFSGGIAPLTDTSLTEAEAAQRFYRGQGFDVGRIAFESGSGTTRENALLTRDLVAPQPGQTWLLVTSAAHMPRAMGCFRMAGFDVLPWPVDYRTVPGMPHWRQLASDRLSKLDDAAREWLGLTWYRLLGWTDAWLPGP